MCSILGPLMEPFDIHKTILGFFRPKEDEEGAAVAGG